MEIGVVDRFEDEPRCLVLLELGTLQCWVCAVGETDVDIAGDIQQFDDVRALADMLQDHDFAFDPLLLHGFQCLDYPAFVAGYVHGLKHLGIPASSWAPLVLPFPESANLPIFSPST